MTQDFLDSDRTSKNYNFSARVWYLASDGIVELDTFAMELEPTDFSHRGVADWAHEYLQESTHNICELFELDPEKDWQIVFNGRMKSWQSFNGEITEYDEDMEILGEPLIAEIPKAFADAMMDRCLTDSDSE